jgi:hypothetical protein
VPPISAIAGYESIVTLGGAPSHAERVAEMRRRFEQRTGAFRHEDAWFEARSRAFWDDAVTRQGFAREVLEELEEGARAWVPAFARAHRGLFRVVDVPEVEAFVLRDVWSEAEFVVDAADDATSEALDAAAGLFDARIVGMPTTVAILPGALFHPPDASEAIEQVILAARARALVTDDVLDALLRMDRKLSSLSRMKPAYAYRAEAL